MIRRTLLIPALAIFLQAFTAFAQSVNPSSFMEGPASGGDGTLFVGSGPWTATSNAGFLHIVPGSASGTGNGSVQFTFDANTGATRTGTLTVGGVTVSVTQAAAADVVPLRQFAPPAGLSGLNLPQHILIDTSGNIVIADTGNNVVKQWYLAFSQIVTQTSGLNAPSGVAEDSIPNLYIADTGSSSIKKGFGTSPVTVITGVTAHGIAVESSGANLYIADYANSVILKWNAASQQMTTPIPAGLNHPLGIALDAAGNLYIADTGNGGVKMWNAATQQLTTLASNLKTPFGIAVDQFGNVYFSDQTLGTLYQWNAAARKLITLKSGLNQPSGVSVDRAGAVYYALQGSGTVIKMFVSPLGYMGPASKNEGPSAGSDSFTVASTFSSLTTNFPATSDQAWLTIGAPVNGLVNFSFTANPTAAPRTAHITMLGSQVTVTQDGAAPDLTINTAGGSFTQGQLGAAYTLTVTNSGAAPTAGPVNVTDILPSGLTPTAFGGAGWTCQPIPALSCTRSDALGAGLSYPIITLTVNVASNAPATMNNIALVSGGGESNSLNDGSVLSTSIVQASPAVVAAIAGTPQSAPAGTAFTTNPQVVVKDGNGNPIPGVPVTFTAPAPGLPGGVFQNTGNNVTTAATNGAGIATASPFTANALAGSYTITASAAGAAASFSFTNTATGAPTTDSAAVATSGSSPVHTILTLQYSSPTGAANLVDVHALINQRFSPANACWVYYDKANAGFYLANDAGNGGSGPFAPGSAGTPHNTQCALYAATSSVSIAGNTLTMVLDLSFTGAAAQSIFLYAMDAANNNSGWSYKGATGAPSTVPPTADSVTGIVNGSLTQGAVTLNYSSANGYNSIADMYVLFNQRFTQVGGCFILYDRPSNVLYLANDSASALLGPMTPGANTSLSNSQCTLNGTGSAATNNGLNTLTLTLNLVFTPAFGTAQNIFMYAFDQTGLNSGWQQGGTISPIAGAPPVNVSANVAGSLAIAQYASANGYQDIADAYVLINSGSLKTNACWIFYDRSANGFLMVNDTADALIGPLPLGSSGTIANTQCTLNGSGSSVSGSGDTLTMTLNLTLNHSFAGAKSVYLNAADYAGTLAGWQVLGGLTVP